MDGSFNELILYPVRKRRIHLARFVARMGDKRLPKRVMFDKLEGGRATWRGQEQDWMNRPEHDLSFLNLTKTVDAGIEELAQVIRRVEEAAGCTPSAGSLWRRRM